jgi:hypothetical protein
MRGDAQLRVEDARRTLAQLGPTHPVTNAVCVLIEEARAGLSRQLVSEADTHAIYRLQGGVLVLDELRRHIDRSAGTSPDK